MPRQETQHSRGGSIRQTGYVYIHTCFYVQWGQGEEMLPRVCIAMIERRGKERKDYHLRYVFLWGRGEVKRGKIITYDMYCYEGEEYHLWRHRNRNKHHRNNTTPHIETDQLWMHLQCWEVVACWKVVMRGYVVGALMGCVKKQISSGCTCSVERAWRVDLVWWEGML